MRSGKICCTMRPFLIFACGFAILFGGCISPAAAGNPIVVGVGMADPHVRNYDNHVYLYATHDASSRNKHFRMNNWWEWTFDDLIHWKLVSILKPEKTYYKKPFDECWSTDAVSRNGKYYWYFSRGPKEIGVVVGDSPVGPWSDPIGKLLIAEGSTPTTARDPAIFQKPDGTSYIVFGCWNY